MRPRMLTFSGRKLCNGSTYTLGEVEVFFLLKSNQNNSNKFR